MCVILTPINFSTIFAVIVCRT